jgi:branched-subunit amino acid transport protein
LLGLIIAFWILSYTYNDWLCETMPRHQLIQLPSMILIGLILGKIFGNKIKLELQWSISILIIAAFSVVFWMIPRSIDLAVIHADFNRLMHVDMIITGFFIQSILKNTIPEVKITFLGMISSMTIATGIALTAFNLLLCSSFTIEQQKETGKLLIIIGILLYFFTLITFFRESNPSTKNQQLMLSQTDEMMISCRKSIP